MAVHVEAPTRSRSWLVQHTWDVVAPTAVLVLAAVLRLVNLGNPRMLVFDETYYVKDAFSLWRFGFEGTWAETANDAFLQGTAELSADPSFVVHPPLGKWILGIGTALGGIEDPAAWRWPAAIVGILVVALTIAIARGLTGSWPLASLAGLFLAIDGQAIVMSRTVLLDQTLALFVLVGAGALLLDRQGAAARIARWRAAHVRDRLGPSFYARPWLVAAGVALGAACAVKWSGAWFLAAFGLWSVALDALDRRRVGLRSWHVGTLVTQAPASFVLVVFPAIATYLATWAGWFGGGYDSTWAADNPAERATGWLSWIPLPLQSLAHYHQQIAAFHVSLASEHPFASPAAGWLVLARPTAFYLEQNGTQMAFITALPNPLIWYAAVIALLVLLFTMGSRLDRRAAFLAVAVGAGYLPWLAFPERTIFSFYSIVFQPFLIIGLVLVLHMLLRSRPLAGRVLTIVLALLAVAASVFFAPIWYGMWDEQAALQLRFWIPSWR